MIRYGKQSGIYIHRYTHIYIHYIYIDVERNIEIEREK